jgi:hypothetical protein
MAHKKILLVEGLDDERVIKELCGSLSTLWLDEIEQYKGVDRLLQSLPLRLTLNDGDNIIGVVIDADEDAGRRWQSIRTRLQTAGYSNIPAIPAPNGTILNPPANTILPRLGVWIMPDNLAPGTLESFLRLLVPVESRLFAHVEHSVATIPQDEVRFSQSALPKVLIYTWLAWQEKPGRSYSTAIGARYFDSHSHQASTFMDWLNHLYLGEADQTSH